MDWEAYIYKGLESQAPPAYFCFINPPSVSFGGVPLGKQDKNTGLITTPSKIEWPYRRTPK